MGFHIIKIEVLCDCCTGNRVLANCLPTVMLIMAVIWHLLRHRNQRHAAPERGCTHLASTHALSIQSWWMELQMALIDAVVMAALSILIQY